MAGHGIYFQAVVDHFARPFLRRRREERGEEEKEEGFGRLRFLLHAGHSDNGA